MGATSIFWSFGLDPQLVFDSRDWEDLLPRHRDWDSWFGASLFDPGYTLSGPAIGDSITLLDGVFFAKGGGGGGKPGGGGGGGVPTEYRAGSTDGSGYNIWIEFKGSGWTTALQAPFKDAADYFTSVITDDIGGGGLYQGKLIDDLYISAELAVIDGPGRILGQAGPTAVWTSNELTAAGQMQFDVKDAPRYLDLGQWDEIVRHEMMHVLGFGSLWNYGVDPLATAPGQYTGEAGLAAYNEHFGSTAEFIPVETDGGAGTAGAHWDETALTNELMTGYLNANTDNYLSDFSVKSLADLGYNVGNYFDYGSLIA